MSTDVVREGWRERRRGGERGTRETAEASWRPSRARKQRDTKCTSIGENADGGKKREAAVDACVGGRCLSRPLLLHSLRSARQENQLYVKAMKGRQQSEGEATKSKKSKRAPHRKQPEKKSVAEESTASKDDDHHPPPRQHKSDV